MKKILMLLFCMILMVSFVSAVKPLTSIQTAEGLSLDPVQKSAIRLNKNHEFDVHVFNISNGVPIISGISCNMHLYFKEGYHIYSGEDTIVSDSFDYSFNLSAGNFSERGEYQAVFSCNDSMLGGSSQLFFIVNGIGEELTTAHSIKFNSTMVFMMILFLCSLIGIFTINDYRGKFALYWVCHLLFVIGTFSVWQFNEGYTTAFTGLAGVWKIMFYFSTIAVFPMIILSLAWIFYIHTMNDDIKRMMDRGMDEDEAHDRAKKNRRRR